MGTYLSIYLLAPLKSRWALLLSLASNPVQAVACILKAGKWPLGVFFNPLVHAASAIHIAKDCAKSGHD